MLSSTAKTDGRIARGVTTRVRIIEMAIDVFANLGYSRSTTKDVARAANVSPGLMYHYFASKEELLEAAIKHYRFVDEMRVVIGEIKMLPANQGIKKCMISLYDLLRERLSLIRVFIQESNTNSHVKDAWEKVLGEGIPELKSYLDSLVTSGQLRQHRTDITARSLSNAIVMFMITEPTWPGPSFSGHSLVEQFVESFLYGIAADGACNQIAAEPFEAPKPPESIDEQTLAFPPGCRGEIAVALLGRFGSIARVADAGFEELKQLEGVGEARAQQIWNHFNERKSSNLKP